MWRTNPPPKLLLEFTAEDYTGGWILYVASLSSLLANLTRNKQSFMLLSFIFSSSIIIGGSGGPKKLERALESSSNGWEMRKFLALTTTHTKSEVADLLSGIHE